MPKLKYDPGLPRRLPAIFQAASPLIASKKRGCGTRTIRYAATCSNSPRPTAPLFTGYLRRRTGAGGGKERTSFHSTIRFDIYTLHSAFHIEPNLYTLLRPASGCMLSYVFSFQFSASRVDFATHYSPLTVFTSPASDAHRYYGHE
jgi:hypothetical protein